MQTERIVLDRGNAKELFRAYRKHQHYSAPIDREIQRVYQHIALGRVVIRALDSIKTAGLYEDGPNKGLPKLAIIRANAAECYLTLSNQGAATFSSTREFYDHHKANIIRFPEGSFPPPPRSRNRWDAAKAVVPLVPIHLRPKRGLANYHILFEAEWQRLPPVDPMLLRRIGRGDMWLVVAAWDLTEVERAALASRLSA